MPDIYKRLEALETIGIKFGLENIRRILSALGNPERQFPSVLIAGTNGKGSVGAMLERILMENGYHTGYYLSPHLIGVRERIRWNGKKISEDAFLKLLERIFQVLDEHTIPATYFEVLTAAAFLQFAEAKLDLAVVEVGLGGRFDATNTVSQSLSIITSIGLDHEAFLGKTLESIATEKAMISKPGVPMVTGNLPDPARKTVEAICAGISGSVYSIDATNIIEPRLVDGFPEFRYDPWDKTVRVNLRGRHQIENAAVALLAAEKLQELGFKLDQNRTIRGLNEVRWPGRLDQVSGVEPPLMLDCAHNPMGVRSLVQYLKDVGWTKSVFLFTAMRDKNIDEMLQTIEPFAGKVTLCRMEPLERCATMEQLTTSAARAGLDWVFDENRTRALNQSLTISRQSNLPLVAFGSIYLIGSFFSELGLST